MCSVGSEIIRWNPQHTRSLQVADARVCEEPLCATVNMMDSRAIFRMDVGFWIRILVRALLKSLYGIRKILTHMLLWSGQKEAI